MTFDPYIPSHKQSVAAKDRSVKIAEHEREVAKRYHRLCRSIERRKIRTLLWLLDHGPDPESPRACRRRFELLQLMKDAPGAGGER